jgi:hypothetical protein
VVGRHQVLVGNCGAGGVQETRLRFKAYETRRGDEFRKRLNGSLVPAKVPRRQRSGQELKTTTFPGVVREEFLC